MTRALDTLPKQADGVWRHPQNFFADYVSMRRSRLDDGVLRFSARNAAGARAQEKSTLAAE